MYLQIAEVEYLNRKSISNHPLITNINMNEDELKLKEYARAFASRGGKARAKKLSPARRREIALIAVKAREAKKLLS